ncbi:hypothetical protein SELMODRAFT_430645 [Selaginella moellendorffii]|uniref:EB1 C-terminal domain-containing protein n=1 Tax=Selaginella moellendorffii TaxID=88036 RepID=D8TA20_SELML|nr:hypothetical protein SELMODRAFT_430645 [Selaginella moellendorffii]
MQYMKLSMLDKDGNLEDGSVEEQLAFVKEVEKSEDAPRYSNLSIRIIESLFVNDMVVPPVAEEQQRRSQSSTGSGSGRLMVPAVGTGAPSWRDGLLEEVLEDFQEVSVKPTVSLKMERRPVASPRRNAGRGIVLHRPSPQRRSRGDGNVWKLGRGKINNKSRGGKGEAAGVAIVASDCPPASMQNECFDENAVQQQAVLESLASYLEGELLVRLQSYAELLAEVDVLNKERLFYYGKLTRMEKVCERAQPYASSVPMVECMLKILAAMTDSPEK